MVGYIEDIELINVSDILSDFSLNTSATQPANERLMNASSSTSIEANRTLRESSRFTFSSENRPVNLHLEHENIEQLNDTTEDNLSRIPNPVGYLQELCVKKGFTLPEYGVLKQEGPSHNPIFATFCQVQEHYRLVSSNSKKKGKEMAAREVIRCLKKLNDVEPKIETDQLNNDTVPSEISTENPSKPTTLTRNMNFVGFLQELCVRKHLPPPNYGTEKSTGTPNNPSFYIFCEVGTYREVGIGSNKKSAKQLAAEKVLELLEMQKTKTEYFETESALAENNEILQSTTKRIQMISDTALETFINIPNPVGHLQELCVRNRLRPPVYDIVQVDGPPHCPTFVTSCKVEQFYLEAASSNKKKGKELAASKILKRLMEYRAALNE